MNDEGMSYKDALEWMTCNPSKQLYDSNGNAYHVVACMLHTNGSVKVEPFCQLKFRNLKLFKSKPKPAPVFIPFWDAVKAMVDDGKCIGKFYNGLLVDRYKYDYGFLYWSTMAHHHWKETKTVLHEGKCDSIKWAIVEDPSNPN